MKTRRFAFTPLLSTIFILASCFAYAQVPVQYRADYNRMMRNQVLHNPGYRTTHFLNSDNVVIPKLTYTVLLKDSSRRIVYSGIHYDEIKHKYYLIHENKEVRKSHPERKQWIYANETISITVPVTVDRPEMEGMATDSCWLFKVLSGKINAYSEYAEIAPLNATHIAAIQTGSGQLERFVPEKLETLISSDGQAHNAFKKQHYYVAIKRFNRRNDNE